MEDSMKVIVFQMDQQKYGANVMEVLSIEELENITSIPRTSEFIKGVVNLRGEITPVIDLKQRLRLGETSREKGTRMLIVQMGDVQAGLLVDEASDVVDIDTSTIEPAPEVINGINESFIKGVAKFDDSLLILLEMDQILNLEEVNELKEAAEEEVE
ncbi:chemotaxis protein CheW [Lentibacillus cibarius]|uniref:Chemotaxis protein CheW n=1 Tax=Lentibacillus cibarius TaxID=2583219 RepID=A0A549YEI0_9BACI|nr:chemotaxis protein CheW [Lentibacillus cibarius]TMN21393.1 chemotaxis protein CheW [Lentibacillus cibarius]TRM10272.1 chemotaxis protein CheW [Lentibacillus cibarius]